MPNIRTVIYARYSPGSNQTDQSIEGQVRVCTEYAKLKGLTIVDTYFDRALTGKNDSRPEFLKMIDDSGKNMFDAIIVYRTDRFARNKYDSAIYKRQLRQNGIQLHYAAETIPDGPEGIILESLLEGMAEYFSAELAQKVKRGMRESAYKCKYIGNKIPLGYSIDNNKDFQINVDEAKLVELIFKMFVDGKTKAEICNYLNSTGAKTRDGKEFAKSSLGKILQNEKYIGIYKYDDIIVEDGVPSIIPKDLFYLAQRELDTRQKSAPIKQPKANYRLSGKLYCSYCQSPTTGISGTSKNGAKHYYYYCSKKDCEKKPISKDFLENRVIECVKKVLSRPGMIEDISRKVWQAGRTETTVCDDVLFFEKKLAENKKAIDNIMKAIEAGAGTETLPKRLKELEHEQAVLKGELVNAQSTNFELTEDHIAFMLYSLITPESGKIFSDDTIINCFVSKVFLSNDKLIIYYNIKKGESLLFEECSTCLSVGTANVILDEHIIAFSHGFAIVCCLSKSSRVVD